MTDENDLLRLTENEGEEALKAIEDGLRAKFEERRGDLVDIVKRLWKSGALPDELDGSLPLGPIRLADLKAGRAAGVFNAVRESRAARSDFEAWVHWFAVAIGEVAGEAAVAFGKAVLEKAKEG